MLVSAVVARLGLPHDLDVIVLVQQDEDALCNAEAFHRFDDPVQNLVPTDETGEAGREVEEQLQEDSFVVVVRIERARAESGLQMFGAHPLLLGRSGDRTSMGTPGPVRGAPSGRAKREPCRADSLRTRPERPSTAPNGLARWGDVPGERQCRTPLGSVHLGGPACQVQ